MSGIYIAKQKIPEIIKNIAYPVKRNTTKKETNPNPPITIILDLINNYLYFPKFEPATTVDDVQQKINTPFGVSCACVVTSLTLRFVYSRSTFCFILVCNFLLQN